MDVWMDEWVNVTGNLVATAEMFPALKDAPKHESASDTAHATPFGVEIRMIQCKRCKQWGHNGTDRECPMRDQNPNDEFRQRLEDPLNLMKARYGLPSTLGVECVCGMVAAV
jgi:hypothetical protein